MKHIFRNNIVAVCTVLFFAAGGATASDQADWPLYRGDAQAQACAPDRVSLPEKLEILWEKRLEKGWFPSSPIIVGDTVFIGSSDEGMSAYRLRDGEPRWTYPLPYGVFAPASYWEGSGDGALLFFGDTEGVFHAVEAETGRLRWKFEMKGNIDNAPNLDRKTGRVLIGSQAGTLYALDAATGKPAWEYKTEDQIRCFPTIAGRRCFIAGCDSRLHLVDLDRGEAVARLELDAPTGSTPTVHGDRVFFGTEGNEIFAVNWKKAEILWRFKGTHAFRGPAACRDGLVVCSGMDRTVRALDMETGEERWYFRAKRTMEYSGPVLAGDRVFVPCSDSFLYVLDLKTGKKRDALELPGKLLGCPAVVDGRIVLGTDDGVLVCLGAAKR